MRIIISNRNRVKYYYLVYCDTSIYIGNLLEYIVRWKRKESILTDDEAFLFDDYDILYKFLITKVKSVHDPAIFKDIKIMEYKGIKYL